MPIKSKSSTLLNRLVGIYWGLTRWWEKRATGNRPRRRPPRKTKKANKEEKSTSEDKCGQIQNGTFYNRVGGPRRPRKLEGSDFCSLHTHTGKFAQCSQFSTCFSTYRLIIAHLFSPHARATIQSKFAQLVSKDGDLHPMLKLPTRVRTPNETDN